VPRCSTRKWGAWAAVVVALGAASCSSPGRLTRAEFTDQANTVCTDSSARIATIAAPDPADADAVADAISQVVVIQRAALEDLDGLRPPEGLEPQVGEWLDLLGEVLDDEEAVAAAVSDGDPATADAANAAAAETNIRAEAAAAELGLDACTVAGTAPPQLPPDTGVPGTDVPTT
jgi:ABC-type enterochelin transport system substrate-binding protein